LNFTEGTFATILSVDHRILPHQNITAAFNTFIGSFSIKPSATPKVKLTHQVTAIPNHAAGAKGVANPGNITRVIPSDQALTSLITKIVILGCSIVFFFSVQNKSIYIIGLFPTYAYKFTSSAISIGSLDINLPSCGL
jgi:hypothetical protein